jgi:cell wall-associated NlpC family hydrolase
VVLRREAERPVMPRTTALVAAATALAAVVLAGCSSSVPRFASPPEEEIPLERVRAEERREDDHKVDLQALSRRLAARPHSSGRYQNATPAGVDRDKMLLEIVGYLGVPYRFGGSSREGMDCSGFTSTVYRAGALRSLPRSTREQYGAGERVAMEELQFGDLVFFNTTGRSPSHVGIYLEDDLFAHASVTYGVTISSLESTYYRKRLVGARRVFP